MWQVEQEVLDFVFYFRWKLSLETLDKYCILFPLHGVGRERIGETQKYEWDGHVSYYVPRSWNIKNCEFDTYEDAVSYFVYYLRKYRNIDLKTTPINPTTIAAPELNPA